MLNCCPDDIKKWLSANEMKLNQDKTLFIIFGQLQCEMRKKFFQKRNLAIPFLMLNWSVRLVHDSMHDFSFPKHILCILLNRAQSLSFYLFGVYVASNTVQVIS